MSRVRIDRLEVRLRGGSVERARELAAALPASLARGLARLAPGDAVDPAPEVRAPAARVPRGATAAEAAAAVAGSVAAGLRSTGRGAPPRGGRS